VKLFRDIITNKGNDLESLSRSSPVILIFLRHFGCVFCKEAFIDLNERKDLLYKNNLKVVFVHMSDEALAEDYFTQFDYEHLEHISDPTCSLYEGFGLSKGKFSQLFGLKVWSRGFELRKKGIKMTRSVIGDSLQMPGLFILKHNKVIASYIHKSIADKPDYEKLISCLH